MSIPPSISNRLTLSIYSIKQNCKPKNWILHVRILALKRHETQRIQFFFYKNITITSRNYIALKRFKEMFINLIIIKDV